MSKAAFADLFLAKYYCSGDEIKENDTRVLCGMYRGEMYERLWQGNLEETDHLKTQAQMEVSIKKRKKQNGRARA